MPHSLSSWLTTSLHGTPASMRRWRYSSIFSAGTAKATWFIEPIALVRSPLSGRAAGADDAGHARGR